MIEEKNDSFPLSRINVQKSSRRIAREKVLQTLFAYKMSDTDVDLLFEHISQREFNFGDEESPLVKDKILKPDEVYELEADIPIAWNVEDKKFLTKLLEHSLRTAPGTDKYMMEIANNWDLDRITLIDRLLIQIACSEFLFFDEIPPKVTINETIEIAKKYSTDKSGNFVNGILDALHSLLKEKGLIVKKGRGLKEK